MFRFLPASLQRLYRRLIDAVPYARGTRAKPLPPAEERPECGRDRHHRLEIAYDAFCVERPTPKKLARENQMRRDTVAWCEARKGWKQRSRPRCHHCERAFRLYSDATNHDDWKAEVALFKIARRGAVRLLAERREYRAKRRTFLARRREAIANGTEKPNPMPEGFVRDLWEGHYASRGSVEGAWHQRDRREVERGLVRAHALHLRRETPRRRERLRDIDAARAVNAQPVGRTSANPASRRPAADPAEATAAPQSSRVAQRRGDPGQRAQRPPRGPRSPMGSRRRQAAARDDGKNDGENPAEAPAQATHVATPDLDAAARTVAHAVETAAIATAATSAQPAAAEADALQAKAARRRALGHLFSPPYQHGVPPFAPASPATTAPAAVITATAQPGPVAMQADAAGMRLVTDTGIDRAAINGGRDVLDGLDRPGADRTVPQRDVDGVHRGLAPGRRAGVPTLSDRFESGGTKVRSSSGREPPD